MNNYEKYQDIFNDFAFYFPAEAEASLSWWATGPTEITIRLKDKTLATHDLIGSRTRFLHRDPESTALSEEDWAKEFGINLGAKMRKAFMSQSDVAERLGVSQATVSNYLNGKRLPNAHRLMRLSEILNCSVTDLIWFI